MISDDRIDWLSTPHGVAVITQNCDAIREGILAVQVCPIARLPSDMASEARKGRRPRYGALPGLDADAFVDFESVATIDKSFLLSSRGLPGVVAATDQRALREAVGRRFSRAALPDSVTLWLGPLQELLREKAGHPNRALSWAFDRILQIRVSSGSGWRGPTYSLLVSFIVENGILPQFPDDRLPAKPTKLVDWLTGKSPSQIEIRLKKTSEPIERHYLWDALGQALIGLCAAVPSSAILDAGAQVIAANEFTLTQVFDSEQLDLDHLSRPETSQRR
ncbi:MAG: hypothetical protein LBT54_02570 [Bifidobacteriaceae bacterium]|jgi:hypothetical protein|nr:hypothetical protein [Bifidobacteriaceae bacterium]